MVSGIENISNAKTVSEKKNASFGLYIHWPFCLSKCPYCDFNSHVRESIDTKAWETALLKELSFVGNLTHGRKLTSVFFGGGTPSLMPPSLVEALLRNLSRYWMLGPELEITLEANPSTVEVSRLRAFKQAGINRLSMGVQSLRDESLKFLGRKHNVKEALQALEVARDTFDRFSFDLIYALPNQTLHEWDIELSEALDLAGDHMSLYQLTIEKGTAFYTAHKRGDWKIPQDDLAADLYQLTEEKMIAAGLPGYEISNYARPGYACEHNLIYWRYQDYAGIGPGAHGRLTLDGQVTATRTHRAPEVWLEKVLSSENSGSGWIEEEKLPSKEVFYEAILMGLRLKEGISWRRLSRLDAYQAQKLLLSDKLETLKEEGLVSVSQEKLCVTESGFPKLNAILNYIL